MYVLLVALLAATPDAGEIMAKVAANVEAAAEARRHYVYREIVHSSLVRSNGDVARREKREYAVAPNEKSTEKTLVSLKGEYRKGKKLIPYSEVGFKSKGLDIDGDLMRDLTNDLVNDKESRDGIPKSLFPLRPKSLAGYRFTYVGEEQVEGRRTHRIAFEPVRVSSCEGDDGCDNDWKGDAWIDAEELQPKRIATDLAWKIPWGVRVFLGTNLRRTGFSISYRRVAENVWFPATYGTEFRLDVLWGYKRTITLSLTADDFHRTDSSSTIDYKLPTQ